MEEKEKTYDDGFREGYKNGYKYKYPAYWFAGMGKAIEVDFNYNWQHAYRRLRENGLEPFEAGTLLDLTSEQITHGERLIQRTPYEPTEDDLASEEDVREQYMKSPPRPIQPDNTTYDNGLTEGFEIGKEVGIKYGNYEGYQKMLPIVLKYSWVMWYAQLREKGKDSKTIARLLSLNDTQAEIGEKVLEITELLGKSLKELLKELLPEA